MATASASTPSSKRSISGICCACAKSRYAIIKFVADAHLGGLARLLRMLGFDTLYSNELTDGQIRAISQIEERVVLTRDRELLKCSHDHSRLLCPLSAAARSVA